MPVIDQSQVVPYTPEEMYALVNDFKSYPQFMPWCERAWVVSEEDNVVRAGLAVRKGAVHYSFETENRGQPPHRIDVALASGPFRRLAGAWQFHPTALGTRVVFHLEFEFENRLVGTALAPVFKLMTSSLVASFRKRAEVVYGRR